MPDKIYDLLQSYDAVKHSRKVLIVGGIMEVFVVLSLLVHHVFFSNESETHYSPIYDIWGNSIHPVLFGGVFVLIGGAIFHFVEGKKETKQ